ncbi:MAG: polyphosphate kinase 1 [Bacteroidota bacterium]
MQSTSYLYLSDDDRFVDRDLSWLSFNERVLQEAQDERNPLLERLSFLAIYSSNLDEFYRVRVAALRNLVRSDASVSTKFGQSPADLLRALNRIVHAQQEAYGHTIRTVIRPQLEALGIRFLREDAIRDQDHSWLRERYQNDIRPRLKPALLTADSETPFLKNRALYLVCELRQEGQVCAYGLVNVPSPPLPRFLSNERAKHVTYIDDVIRAHGADVFPGYDVGPFYSVKLSRDAELYVDEDSPEPLVQQVNDSLVRRETGAPSRFLYDTRMPASMLEALAQRFQLSDDDLMPGGRYHNLHDYFGFPDFNLAEHRFHAHPPHAHPLTASSDLFAAIRERDHLIQFPYQSYAPVTRFLETAADDPDCTEIRVTLYRVASNSAVTRALIRAAKAGKKVTVFIEVKARFDEAPNIHWGRELQEAGAHVLYSIRNLKVHAKLAQVVRETEQGTERLTYVSTGNFNEKTSRVYTDLGVFTAGATIGHDVETLFLHLAGTLDDPTFESLLVAPFTLRSGFENLIDREISHAKAGRHAAIRIKLNSLEDPRMIEKLYAASQAGVHIELILRGICCLRPNQPGLSETITVRSIVDRYLEHWRAFRFHNDGHPELYISSADWMTRNLSRRIEVALPVLDPTIASTISRLLDMQWADTAKARELDRYLTNTYCRPDGPSYRSQYEEYIWAGERSGATSEAV